MTHDAPPHRQSRRKVVVAATAGAAAFGIGGTAWVASRDPRQLIIALLEHALPGVKLDQRSLQTFAQDYTAEFFERFADDDKALEQLASLTKVKVAESVRQTVGVERFVEMGPFKARAEEMIRRAVTRYLMNSNYFDLADPRREAVVYRFLPSGTACTNPFANIGPPEEGATESGT